MRILLGKTFTPPCARGSYENEKKNEKKIIIIILT